MLKSSYLPAHLIHGPRLRGDLRLQLTVAYSEILVRCVQLKKHRFRFPFLFRMFLIRFCLQLG